MKFIEIIAILILTCIAIIAANLVGYKGDLMASVIGIGIILVIGVIGVIISKIPGLNKLPMVAWVSAVAIYASSPIFPWSKEILMLTGKVQFMAIATPILAYAGLAIGKDLEMFKKLSWRIIPVALAVCAGTFLFAAIIAQVALKWEGVI